MKVITTIIMNSLPLEMQSQIWVDRENEAGGRAQLI